MTAFPGALLADEVFVRLASKAKDGLDLADGVDEFLASASLLPPAMWAPKVRCEPPPTMRLPRRHVGNLRIRPSEFQVLGGFGTRRSRGGGASAKNFLLACLLR